MPKLIDLSKAQVLGDISPEDAAYLRGKLKAGCSLSRAALEGFRTDGGERLYRLLSGAIGADESLDLGVGGSSEAKPFKVRGRILDKGRPCPCVKIEAYDEHPVADAWMGAAFTGPDGAFELAIDDKDFRGEAALLLVVSRWGKEGFVELTRLKPRDIAGRELSLGDVDVAD